jgi:hypothetical protein
MSLAVSNLTYLDGITQLYQILIYNNGQHNRKKNCISITIFMAINGLQSLYSCLEGKYYLILDLITVLKIIFIQLWGRLLEESIDLFVRRKKGHN